jgi:hypothetical protein
VSDYAVGQEDPATFRALWPIIDPSVSLHELTQQAHADLPALTRRAHCRLTGRGRWWIADSRLIPGSGRVTDTCLIYDAPAVSVHRRAYHRSAA